MFGTVGNGLWKMGQMGNGALGGSGALGALGSEMLGNEDILKGTEAIRLTRCIDSCLSAIKDSNCNIDGIKFQFAKRGLQFISTLRFC
jgi:hypothetical protein